MTGAPIQPALLDINLLIALFDSAHVHHEAAHFWFKLRKEQGWRTCPLTENGLLCILSHPAYPNQPLPISEIALRLEELKESSAHYLFWPDEFSTSKWMAEGKIACSSRSLTDAYLLRLASNHKGVLATFDRGIQPDLYWRKQYRDRGTRATISFSPLTRHT